MELTGRYQDIVTTGYTRYGGEGWYIMMMFLLGRFCHSFDAVGVAVDTHIRQARRGGEVVISRFLSQAAVLSTIMVFFLI